MLRSQFAVAVALTVLGAGFASAADIESGLELGEKTSAFNVKDITGPNQGKSLCYRCRYGGRPVVSIFTRGTDGEVQSLVDQIDEVVGKNTDSKMAGFVVLLSDDEDADAPQLTKLAESKKIENTPLTVFDGVTGPPEYKIAKDADVTVLMWVRGEVKANHAFGKGELDKAAVDKIVADTKKILE